MAQADHANTTSPPPGARPAATFFPTSATEKADPIFAVLADHRAAVKAYLAASEIDGNLETGTPEWEAANAVTQAAIKREREMHHTVLTTQPTTMAGVIALLEHVGQDRYLGEAEDHDRETVLSASHVQGSSLVAASREFPLRLATTVRGLTRLHQLRGVGDAKVLKSLGRSPKGRHYRR
jgi:hypothetical protein